MNKFSRRTLLIGGCAIGLAVSWKVVKFARRGHFVDHLGAFSYPAIKGLQQVDGSPTPGLSSDDLAGKTSLIVAFASWCPYCQAQHAKLMDFSRRLQKPIYGVDCNDAEKDCLHYLRKYGNPFKAVGFDPSGGFLSLAQARGVPCNLVIGPDLQVLWAQSEDNMNIGDIESLLI